MQSTFTKIIFIYFIFLSLPSFGQKKDLFKQLAPLTVQDELLENENSETYQNAISALKTSEHSKKTKKYLKNQYSVRKRVFANMLNNGLLITEGDLYDYVQGITDKITKASGVASKRKLYIVRKNSPNAFNMGDNSIFIHLGLIYRMNNEAELAYVIGHELGHNELHHYESRMCDYAALIENDSIRKRKRDIYRVKYGRVSALNELMIPWILSSKKKSRTNEEEADDFGYNSIKKCGYNSHDALGIFDILENTDHERDSANINFITDFYINDVKSDYSKSLNLKVDNSLGAVAKNKDSLDDLLRTHPFSIDRQIEFEKWVSKETISVVSKSNEKFLRNKQLSELEIIASSIYHKRIDRAIYYAIHFHKRDSTNEIVNKIIPFCFAYLGYQKQNRRAGKHINSQSPNYDDKYNEYLNFLRFLKPDQCYDLAENWNNIYNSGKHANNAIATDAILHLAKKDYDNFILRYEKEFEESNNYFIMPILEFLKAEKHL